ncbi:hypothetical protein PIB30_006918 [Stylosanthes scabra]|uniref:BED-type domain-containing protein n=1 Tax=Stylosanthes scabra TaxID=79078 RepID=A0ABU6X649_9FABA|nr:hypothetical protein [Stylosanthes scabra]
MAGSTPHSGSISEMGSVPTPQTHSVATSTPTEATREGELVSTPSASLQTDAQPSQVGKKKANRPPSIVWEHFTKNEDETKAKCKHCRKELQCHSRRDGTSNLKKHIGTCKKNPQNHVDKK